MVKPGRLHLSAVPRARHFATTIVRFLAALISKETEPSVAAANRAANFFMTTSNFGQVDVSRLLPARFHAHLILRFAGRTGIIFHAGSSLLAADFAA